MQYAETERTDRKIPQLDASSVGFNWKDTDKKKA